jgi:hypothetical protein
LRGTRLQRRQEGGGGGRPSSLRVIAPNYFRFRAPAPEPPDFAAAAEAAVARAVCLAFSAATSLASCSSAWVCAVMLYMSQYRKPGAKGGGGD